MGHDRAAEGAVADRHQSLWPFTAWITSSSLRVLSWCPKIHVLPSQTDAFCIGSMRRIKRSRRAHIITGAVLDEKSSAANFARPTAARLDVYVYGEQFP